MTPGSAVIPGMEERSRSQNRHEVSLFLDHVGLMELVQKCEMAAEAHMTIGEEDVWGGEQHDADSRVSA